MNYTELVQAIKDYTENTETTFTNHIDEFINQAETRILFDVDLPYFRKNSTGTTTESNSYLGKPSDFLSAHSLAVVSSGNVYSYLLPKDVSFMREANPDTDTKGEPEHYAHFDNTTFILSPVPDAAYTMELHYKCKPTGLSSSNANTWLGDNLSQALLYGCLVEAYTFMKGEAELLKFYNDRFMESIQWLKKLGEGLQTRDQYRYDRVRRAVA